MSATGDAPVLISSGANVRPMSGVAPIAVKNPEVTTETPARRGSEPVVTLAWPGPIHRPIDANELDRSR